MGCCGSKALKGPTKEQEEERAAKRQLVAIATEQRLHAEQMRGIGNREKVMEGKKEELI